jgi:hypothetical protein
MPKHFTADETFTNLIIAACDDTEMRTQIIGILRLPQNARLAVLSNFVQTMHQQSAPSDFIAAIEFLKNEGVAEKVLALLAKQ